jgi:DNA-binding NarL/FixJ family response regulator
MGPLRKISVLLADDYAVLRQGLRALLEAEGDIKIVGEARNGREAVKLARTLRPDVILMGIAMPVLNGLEATRQILDANPSAKVLILSAHRDAEYVEHMTAIGAAGYLVKQTSAAILTRAVRRAAKSSRPGGPAGGKKPRRASKGSPRDHRARPKSARRRRPAHK